MGARDKGRRKGARKELNASERSAKPYWKLGLEKEGLFSLYNVKSSRTLAKTDFNKELKNGNYCIQWDKFMKTRV